MISKKVDYYDLFLHYLEMTNGSYCVPIHEELFRNPHSCNDYDQTIAKYNALFEFICDFITTEKECSYPLITYLYNDEVHVMTMIKHVCLYDGDCDFIYMDDRKEFNDFITSFLDPLHRRLHAFRKQILEIDFDGI